MASDNNILQAIPEDVVPSSQAILDAQRPDRFVSSNGIVFKLKPVAPLLIMDAQRNLPEPVPPKVPNYDKGEGEDAPLEENPNDPTYIREMEAHRLKVGELSNAIFLTRGTELISVPEGVDAVESEEWSDEVKEFAGLDVPKVGRRRYYAWLKYVALTSLDDFQGLLTKLTSLGGITQEADVAEAERSFRDITGGGTAEGVSAN